MTAFGTKVFELQWSVDPEWMKRDVQVLQALAAVVEEAWVTHGL
jgi:hypothetical protein